MYLFIVALVVQLPSSLLPSAPAQPNRTQTLPFHHLYNMNSSALINPLMLPGQESTQSARSDQQQQMALLQQLWGLATNPVIATSLGMNLPNHTPVGLATNAVNPSVMLPSSFTNPTTNHNPPLLPGGLNPTLFAGAIPAFVSTPSAPSANALAAAAAATVASADLNVFIQQARTIAAAAIQPQPHALEPPPSLSGLNDPLPTGRPPFVLYISCDDESLSDYQCLVRRQIELFEATVEDVESNAQGRNRPIVLGQVGIRCRHCSMLPPKHRERGAIYYPAKLQGIYQAAQNLAVAHLGTHCLQIPAEIRDQLTMLRERKSSAGGGKKYWADGVRVLGVLEGRDGLRFAKL